MSVHRKVRSLSTSRALASIASIACLLSLFACGGPMVVQGSREAHFPRAHATRTVVFIHGMYLTAGVWEPWQRSFEEHGFRTLAPEWPAHRGSAAEQRRRHPDPKLAALTLEEVITHYQRAIEQLDEPPFLIGHSMGGLVVQALLARGVGAAGVAIDSAPPKGVISLRWSFLKSNWGVISPFADLDEPLALSFEDFQYAFANTVSASAQKQAYEGFIVPESRRVGKGPTTDIAKIAFEKARAPLLLIAGSEDRIIPRGLVRENFERYEDAPAITDYKEFPARSHWIVREQGWNEVASYAMDWLQKQQEEIRAASH